MSSSSFPFVRIVSLTSLENREKTGEERQKSVGFGVRWGFTDIAVGSVTLNIL